MSCFFDSQCSIEMSQDPPKMQFWNTKLEATYVSTKYSIINNLILQITAICNKLIDLSTHTHTRLTAVFLGLPGWASTRKVKPIWILLMQETVRGSGISRAICKSAPRFRQITTPERHHSVFYRADALPAIQPRASKH